MTADEPEMWVTGEDDGSVAIVCSRESCMAPGRVTEHNPRGLYYFPRTVEPYRASPADVQTAWDEHIAAHHDDAPPADDRPATHQFRAPDDAKIITAEVYAVGYLRPDGSRGYGVGTHGDEPLTSFLGLLMCAEADMADWRKTGWTGEGEIE